MEAAIVLLPVRTQMDISFFGVFSKKPVLQINVLAEEHSLTTVAEQLFEHHLSRVLGEDLDDHLWSFTLNEKRLRSDVTLQQLHIEQDMQLLFSYDMGSPTRISVLIDRVVAPAEYPIADYPMKKPETGEQANKRQRVSEQLASAAPAAVTFDTAFPLLCRRLLEEHQVRLELGYGSDVHNGSGWISCCGGGIQPSYTTSIDGATPFTDANELFACLEAGIARQTGAGFPTMNKKAIYRRPDGSTYSVIFDEYDNMEVHLRPFPRSVAPASFPDEYYRLPAMFTEGRRKPHVQVDAADVFVEQMDRWAFNFQLDEAWLPTFDFTATFPKCARWLTYQGAKSAHWFSFTNGVLSAHKVKNGMKRVSSCNDTLEYESLHECFLDMEAQLVLPKKWGKL